MKLNFRRKKLLALELCAAALVLTIAYWYTLPLFTQAQSFNTEENFPDPRFRKAVEKFMGVEPGGQCVATTP